ncbi:Purine nucleoside phosphorylase-like protein [Dinothrombium tinctorium]|uniref:Purine nucleoside phosphorylase n=1 Tax=Dinothrombium tinctorium TaxID=1965070 RepID=A0A3S3R2W8_9ACAR|nr:Purine nucleoside phosphorylase-like protein [Dinothrombium tinctorium]
MVEAIAKFLLEKTKHRPKIGIICGSGLGGIADKLENQDIFPYETIPSFPISTVAGHNGRLVFGTLKSVAAVCMKGRFHPYEGYEVWQCAMPIRVMKLVGVTTLIVTNAAGGINSNFKVGDIMLIKDHINVPGMSGLNPLRGRNDERLGPRFLAMNRAYNLDLMKLLKNCAKELKLSDHLQEGVYCMVGGPSYETVAEVKALHALGADAVGMSTVHEVIFARHCNIRVLGISLITNKCVTDYESNEETNHEEVMEVANKRATDLENLISEFVFKIKDVI